MRYIQVPADISVQPVAEAPPGSAPEAMSFRRFAALCWLDDDRAIEGGFTKQVRWAKVIDAFQATAPGRVLQLEDEDFAVLRAVAESPRVRVRPSIAVQLLDFTRVVLDASDKAPATASAEALS